MAKKRKVITRKEAIAQAKSVYFTGVECKKGHIDYRYVTSGTCLECQRLARLAERVLIKNIRDQAAV